MRRIPIILILLMTFLWTPSATLAKEQLAVMDLKAKYGVEKGLAEALSDIIRTEIYNYGEYEVLSKDDLEIVAKREQIQQKLGCEDDNMCLITFGQAIGTKYMVAGALSKIGNIYSIDLRLLDTKGEEAGVKKRANQTCECQEGELINAARIVAASLMGEKKSPQISNKSAEKKQPDQVKSVPKEIGRDGHFIAYDNGTVLDNSTGLMWAGKDNGKDINWSDAKQYCENYQGGGYTDWRMPTQDELEGLYSSGKSYQATQRNYDVHLTELIRLSGCCPWASETNGSKAAAFGFNSGYRRWFNPSGFGNTRALPVRSGK